MDLALGLLISYFYFFALAEKTGGASTEVQNQQLPPSSKSLKVKTTKAERRALQEAQRAAKVFAKGSISFNHFNCTRSYIVELIIQKCNSGWKGNILFEV